MTVDSNNCESSDRREYIVSIDNSEYNDSINQCKLNVGTLQTQELTRKCIVRSLFESYIMFIL